MKKLVSVLCAFSVGFSIHAMQQGHPMYNPLDYQGVKWEFLHKNNSISAELRGLDIPTEVTERSTPLNLYKYWVYMNNRSTIDSAKTTEERKATLNNLVILNLGTEKDIGVFKQVIDTTLATNKDSIGLKQILVTFIETMYKHSMSHCDEKFKYLIQKINEKDQSKTQVRFEDDKDLLKNFVEKFNSIYHTNWKVNLNKKTDDQFILLIILDLINRGALITQEAVDAAQNQGFINVMMALETNNAARQYSAKLPSPQSSSTTAQLTQQPTATYLAFPQPQLHTSGTTYPSVYDNPVPPLTNPNPPQPTPRFWNFTNAKTALASLATAAGLYAGYNWLMSRWKKAEPQDVLVNKTNAPLFVKHDAGDAQEIAVGEQYALPQSGVLVINTTQDGDENKALKIDLDRYTTDRTDHHLNITVYDRWFSSWFTVPISYSTSWAEKTETAK